MTLFQDLQAAGCEMDHHESDLYVKATPKSLAIIRDHQPRGWRAFTSQIDREIWLDIPFAYDPFLANPPR